MCVHVHSVHSVTPPAGSTPCGPLVLAAAQPEAPSDVKSQLASGDRVWEVAVAELKTALDDVKASYKAKAARCVAVAG